MSLVCTVVSFVPFEIFEEKPGLIPPNFRIPESDGKTPQLLEVGTATHYVYIDQTRGHLPVRNPADVISRSIVDDYCSSQLGVDLQAMPALFWVEGKTTIEEVLKDKVNVAKHLIKQKRWFTNIIKVADDDWRKYHQHNVISDFQRKIGEFMGLDPREHEWMSVTKMIEGSNKSCPFCQSLIEKDAVVCSVCLRTIDPKREQEIENSLSV